MSNFGLIAGPYSREEKEGAMQIAGALFAEEMMWHRAQMDKDEAHSVDMHELYVNVALDALSVAAAILRSE